MSQKKVATYVPEDVSVTVNGADIRGFADGTFVNAERNNQGFTLQVGSDGSPTRSKNPDRSGTITLTLQGSSAGNDTLTALAALDEESSNGVATVVVADNSGRTLCQGRGWVQKLPAREFAREISNVEWVFECGVLNIIHGGNTLQ
jgi:hypothetical protein